MAIGFQGSAGRGRGVLPSPRRQQQQQRPRAAMMMPINTTVARTVLAILASCYLCGLYGQLYWTHRGGDGEEQQHHGVHRRRNLERALGDVFRFGFNGDVSEESSPSSSSSSVVSAGDDYDYEEEQEPGRWRGLHRGRVLSEFLDRVLSRRIAQSDVLVVAPDVDEHEHVSIPGSSSSLGPGATVISRAKGEGHAVHSFHPTINLTDHYFGQHETDPNKPKAKPPGWILLAYLIPDDTPSSSRSDSDGRGSGVDDVMHPSRFDALLTHSTVTYVVFHVGSLYDPTKNSVTDISGLVAIRTLLGHKYKIQIMAVSHHAGRRRRGGVDESSGYYGPNDLLTSEEELEEFLVAGAEAAGEAAAAEVRGLAGVHGTTGKHGDGVRFEAYLFATQGLDLAIPSRSTHLDLDSTNWRGERMRRKERNEDQMEFYDTFGAAPDEGLGATMPSPPPPPLAGCPTRHDEIHLDFVAGRKENGEDRLLRLLVGETSILYTAEAAGTLAAASSTSTSTSTATVDGYQSVTIGEGEGDGAGGITYTVRELWLSRTDDPHSSEAACVRVSRTPTTTINTAGDVDHRRPMVSCATRVLPQREAEGRIIPPRPPRKPTAPVHDGGNNGDEDMVKPTANLPRPPPAATPGKRYNVLSILIDPISRPHFRRSLPRTSALLSEKLNFTSFERYTVVGGNSGPNQAALFSGVPLTGGREGISSSVSHSTTTNANVTGTNTKRWMWDRLRDEGGYATLKLEDGCVLNSNMVQSLRPNTTHGEQLQGLFCFDYDRPNCVGGTTAAGRALHYAEHFVDAYSSPPGGRDGGNVGEGRRERQPWAAFLSFIDSHEDSMAVAGILDDELHGFLSGKVVSDALDDTLVLVLSDHGLHYGPYFQTPRGEMERAQPILHVRLPDDFTRSSSSAKTGTAPAAASAAASALRLNAAGDMFVTPFDVHETVLHVALGIDGTGDVGIDGGVGGGEKNDITARDGRMMTTATATATATKLGSTLLHPLPGSRRTCGGTPGVPDEYCRLLGDGSEGVGSDGGGIGVETSSSSGGTKGACTLPPRPPSVMSYYSDVPREHRPPRWSDDCGQLLMMTHEEMVDTDGNCSCSTNGGDWHPCDTGVTTGIGDPPATSAGPDPFLRLASCDGEKGVRASIAFEPRRELVDRYASMMTSRSNRPPNILIVNIDSVLSGDAAAERHLPRTLRFLRRHRIVRSRLVDEGAGEGATTFRCPTGFCAARFAKSASPGASPDRLPSVLTGCVDRVSMESSNLHSIVRELGGAGRVFRYPSFGERSNRTVCDGGPTLLDVARDHGYVTFHADDFCKEDGVMDASRGAATQNHATDYTLGNEAFCSFKEERARVDDSASRNRRRCVDERSRHRIAFESVAKLRDAYPDIPVFAFLNTGPFDRDALDLADLVHGADEFDDELSSFLEGMLARGDANNSIIVIHSSDHRRSRMDGVSSFDYSFEVERLSPFTAIFVPVSFSGLSVSALSENQRGGRLITDFDLHQTLERLIESSLNTRAMIPSRVAQRVRRESDLLRGAFADFKTEDGDDEHSSLPLRSYDLLKSRIPSERTCSNAGIPSSLCPCMNDM